MEMATFGFCISLWVIRGLHQAKERSSSKSSVFLPLFFENYKSLDEKSPSGITDLLLTPSVVASVLKRAFSLYRLINCLSREQANKLRSYFQVALEERSRLL
ncbi:hypothetical protein Hdeb2414_s0008g00282651 [Helianthus debilis subsp. tardiflorus]